MNKNCRAVATEVDSLSRLRGRVGGGVPPQNALIEGIDLVPHPPRSGAIAPSASTSPASGRGTSRLWRSRSCVSNRRRRQQSCFRQIARRLAPGGEIFPRLLMTVIDERAEHEAGGRQQQPPRGR